jgi:hypothetical protein
MSVEGACARVGCPREDDVVIIRTNNHWEVGLAPGPASIIWNSYGDALAYVRVFARTHGVDVWVARDGGSFESVVCHRAAAR